MVYAILIPLSLGFLSLLYFLLSRRPVCSGRRAGKVRAPIEQVLDPENAPNVKYELKNLSAPVLTGYPFRWLVRFGGYTRLSSLIIPRIKHDSNLDLLDGEYIPEAPTLYPPVSLPLRKEDIEESNNKVLDDIARSYTPINGRRISSLDYWNAYKSGSTTPLDVARAVLECVQASNARSPPLRAIVKTDQDLTMRLAEESTKRWKEGKPLSLIDGVPIAVKPEYKFNPFPLTGGLTFKPVCADIKDDSVVAKRLVEAGAILIGISNMQEFGTGTLGSNPHKEFQTARNPYNEKCYCGGSSSGSAAAVASGLCPITLGTDGGGSVRLPSSLCGVTGLKPTFRCLDSTGCLPSLYSLCSDGPLCTSSIDAAIAMSIMIPGGFDMSGLASINDLSGLRIGVYKEYFEHADPQTVSLCRKALQVLVSLGAQVKDIVIPELEELRVAHFATVAPEFLCSLAVDVDKNFDKISDETLLVLSTSQYVSAKEFINAQKQRTRSIAIVKSLFEEVDLIATPMAGTVAPVIPPGAEKFGYGNAEVSAKIMRFAVLGNFTGIPGISIPVGLTTGEGGGLPVGLQLQGQWNNEGLLLRVGCALEKCLPMEKSPIYYNILERAQKE